MPSNANYFVRNLGIVRGPFPIEAIVSMQKRNRLPATAELSRDRVNWVFPDAIPELDRDRDARAEPPTGTLTTLSMDHLRPDPPANRSGMTNLDLPSIQALDRPLPHTGALSIHEQPADANAFYCIDGISHGPVALARLPELVVAGVLRPHDFVWIEGSPAWVEACDVPQLGIPDQVTRAKRNIRQSPVLIACLALMATLMLAVPTYIVFASDAYKSRQHAAERARQEAQRQEELRLEAIARTEQHRHEEQSLEREAAAQANQQHQETLQAIKTGGN